MQNQNISQPTRSSLELFHIQTNTSFELPTNSPLIHIGKPNDQTSPDIDVSSLPDADIVSRTHAQIKITENIYFIEDLGSSNGTFLNNIKLVTKTPYRLSVGDKISLGQGDKITFLFQFNISSSPTELQTRTSVDKITKLIGLGTMVTGIVMLAANLRIGIFVSFPGVLLCIAGIYLLFQRQFNHNFGWVLIALGMGVMIFSGNVFASGNLLVMICSFALFFAGYQLWKTGKVLNYNWKSISNLLNK